jgi:hypothetical protein
VKVEHGLREGDHAVASYLPDFLLSVAFEII